MRKGILIFILAAAVLLLLLLWPRNAKAAEVTSEQEADVDATGKTRGQRNNNPLNLRPSADDAIDPWVGESGKDLARGGPFLKFDTPTHGLRAGTITLHTYLQRGQNTVRLILETFAKENPTDSVDDYVAAVCSKMGVAEDQVLQVNDLDSLAAAMSQYEQGIPLGAWMTAAEISEGFTEAHNQFSGAE